MSGLPTPPAGTSEVGIDIIKVDRIRAAIAKHGRRFAKRVLTDHEDAYVRDRPENFAGRWAAKEAVSKAFGTGIGAELGWNDIEILRRKSGEPELVLHGRAKEFAGEIGVCEVKISLTHAKHYAAANAVVLGE